MIKIILADDHWVVREAVAKILKPDDIDVISFAGNGEEAVELYREHHPEVIVLDLEMPKKDGLLAARDILRSDPEAKVVIFSGVLENINISVLKTLGVLGFVQKSGEKKEDLRQAIECAKRGEVFYCVESTKNMLQLEKSGDVLASLSPNEKVVALLLACAMSCENIGIAMNIAESTVRTHKNNVFKKLGIHSVNELIGLAKMYGVSPTCRRAA